jgi:hypothetical protein
MKRSGELRKDPALPFHQGFWRTSMVITPHVFLVLHGDLDSLKIHFYIIIILYNL